jgi:predicted  nucleic acid-binding Zn-ribbon protein
MTKQKNEIESAADQLQKIFLGRYEAMLPDAVEKFKDYDLGQIKQALAENETMRNSLTIAVFAQANKFDDLGHQIQILTEAIRGVAKAAEFLKGQIERMGSDTEKAVADCFTQLEKTNKELATLIVAQPAGGGKAN